MNPPSLDKLEGAFLAAVAAREAGQPVDVTRICGGDEALAAEVRSLLRHLDQAGPDDDAGAAPGSAVETLRLGVFLNPAEFHTQRVGGRTHGTIALSGAGEWGASTLGQRVGEFTLIGQLGAGGMGIVFVAAQDHPARTVALKLVRRALTTPTMVRRFEREAQLLGRLNHPGIAQVYAAGVTEIAVGSDGAPARAPFIAMELVEGPTILDYVRQHRGRAGHALALRLVAQVCDAIEHAHLRGVIHRDLKPANVLIATDARGGGPQVKVLDFGVARQADDDTRVGGAGPAAASGAAREAESLPTTQLTFHGHLIGTLAYMSPEQVGSSGAADARCDVYALGAILHQLLSDSLPIDVTDCTIVEAARRIAVQEPPRLGAIDRALRGDVETIVAKALEKDPARRYQSPGELARDLRHHLAGEPIEARRESLIYVLRKRASRYRALSAAAVFTLACAVVFSLYARDQHGRQVRAARLAVAAQNEAESARRRADATAARLADELSASRVAEGRLLGSSGDLAGAERLLWDEMLARPGAHAARWALWELYCNSGCAATFAAHAGECRAVVVAPDGKHVASCGDDAFVRVWSLPGGEMVAEHDTGLRVVRAIAYAPDGREIAAAGEGGAVVIDVVDGRRRALSSGAGADAWGVDVSANGWLVAVADGNGAVRVFERASGRQVVEIPRVDGEGLEATRAARCVSFDGTGGRLAAGYEGGAVKLWSLSGDGGRVHATPGPAVAGHGGAAVTFVRFSPGGDLLASGGTDRNLKLWRVDGTLVASTPTNNGTARAAAFSADGQVLAVPGFWRTRFFDARSGDPLPQPRGMKSLGDGGAFGACFTPDGRYLITAQSGGSVRAWDLLVDPSVALGSTPSPVRDLAALRVGDECVLATVQVDGTVLVRAAPVGRELQTPWRDVMRCNAGEQLRCLALAPDASRVIVGRADGHVLTLDGRDGRIVQDLDAHRGAVGVVRLTADGRLLVTSGADGHVRVWRWRADGRGWDAAGGAAAAEGDVVAAALSPDGAVLATASAPSSLRFWSIGEREVRLLHEVATAWSPWRAAFSADGARLAVGTWDREIQLWNTHAIVSGADSASTAAPARHELDLVAHTEFVAGQAFDDTGRLLASVSSDGTMRVWDLRAIPANERARREASSPASVLDNRRCLATLDAQAGDAWCVSFLPAAQMAGAATGDVNQSVVAAGYTDGAVRLWNLHHFHDAIVRHAQYQRGLRGLPVRPLSPASPASPGTVPTTRPVS